MLPAVLRSPKRLVKLMRHQYLVAAWKDPVWSKVIATGITALIGTGAWLFWPSATSRTPKKSSATNLSTVGPRLSIVDLFTPTDNTVEFKLKNSGDDSAFLKSVSFVFESVTVACPSCETEIATVYTVRATINNEQVVIKPNYEGATETTTGPQSGMHTALSRPSPLIKISESIPPRGVGSFRVRFDFDDSDGLFINASPVRAYAIIAFDSQGQITTPYFSMLPNGNSAQVLSWQPD